MSARDSESGSSTYKGGSGSAGGLGNGGVGGGMGGGGNHRGGSGGGGGAGRNGGIGNKTGLTTGKDWYGNTAFGRSGGRVSAYGTRDARSLGRAGMGPTVGSFGNFRTPTGQAMFAGSPVQGMTFNGMSMGQALSQAQRAQAAWEAAQRRQSVPGLLGGAQPAGISATPQYPGFDAEMALPEYPPVTEIDIPFPDEVVPAPPVNNFIVTGMPSPDPVLGSYPPSVSTVTRGQWPGQNTLYRKGQGGKPINDRVPTDPSFGGNTFNNETGHVGTVGGRGWGGWNTPWN